MSDIKAKKQMLVAESEVYRQLLKLEIQTFKVYGMRTRRRLTSFNAYFPYVLSGVPILTRLFRGRKKKGGFSLARLASLLVLGWKTYKQIAPIFGKAKFAMRRSRPQETAAEEYLSKRL
jgi:hypothetical protein